jgi:hypothetical protein
VVDPLGTGRRWSDRINRASNAAIPELLKQHSRQTPLAQGNGRTRPITGPNRPKPRPTDDFRCVTARSNYTPELVLALESVHLIDDATGIFPNRFSANCPPGDSEPIPHDDEPRFTDGKLVRWNRIHILPIDIGTEYEAA